MTRDSLAFIGRSYQPFWVDSAIHARSSLAASRSVNTKTDLTHSRSVALLTRLHPKCPFQVKLLRVRAFLLLLPSTGVLRSSRTIWSPEQTGQYGTLPIPTANLGAAAQRRAVPGSRSHSASTVPRRRHGHRWLGTAGARTPRHVQLVGSMSSTRLARLIPRSKCPVSMSSFTARSTISRYDAWSQSRYGAAHSSYSKSSANRPSYAVDQRVDLLWGGHWWKRLDQSSAVVAPARDEFGIKPDQIRIVMEVPGRQVVDVALLEHSTQEIHRLVERIQRVERVKFRP